MMLSLGQERREAPGEADTVCCDWPGREQAPAAEIRSGEQYVTLSRGSR